MVLNLQVLTLLTAVLAKIFMCLGSFYLNKCVLIRDMEIFNKVSRIFAVPFSTSCSTIKTCDLHDSELVTLACGLQLYMVYGSHHEENTSLNQLFLAQTKYIHKKITNLRHVLLQCLSGLLADANAYFPIFSIDLRKRKCI